MNNPVLYTPETNRFSGYIVEALNAATVVLSGFIAAVTVALVV